jgi:cytochrome c oxidase accessory protein FixG
MRALNEPFTALKAVRKVTVHAGHLLASLALAHVAVALFIPREELGAMIPDGPLAHPVAFGWTMALTALAYFDFGWFREQFCVVLCPYGRLQSVMHDRDSVIVGYDLKRGEPRGPLKKPGFGDCIDCKKCVTACPTAIDIRDGLQMECVACAQCADACDKVMAKIGKPSGLIRYASLNELDGQPRRVVRPRLLVYAALFTVFAGAFVTAIALRKPFEANVLRLPGPPYVIDEGRIRNGLFVHLVNKSPERRTYWVKVEGPQGAEVKVEPSQVELGSLESTQVSVVAWLPRASWRRDLHVEVTVEEDDGTHREQDVPFVGPLLPR